MTTLFEFPLVSEILTAEEIAAMSGCSRKADQADWLASNGWTFLRNRTGEPVVGRLYARLKLAGINPATWGAHSGWIPDYSKVR